MISHNKTHYSQFSTRQLFALVSDIESYPEFLPWCSAARVLSREDNILIAELAINVSPISQKYKSKITLTPPQGENDECAIKVELIEGPFNELNNHWQFIPGQDQTKVEFAIEFEFTSKVLQNMVGLMFETAMKKMVAAFEERAQEVYSSE